MGPEITRKPVAFEKLLFKWFIRIGVVLSLFFLYVHMSETSREERRCEATCKEQGFPCHQYKHPIKYVYDSAECHCFLQKPGTSSDFSKGKRVF